MSVGVDLDDEAADRRDVELLPERSWSLALEVVRPPQGHHRDVEAVGDRRQRVARLDLVASGCRSLPSGDGRVDGDRLEQRAVVEERALDLRFGRRSRRSHPPARWRRPRVLRGAVHRRAWRSDAPSGPSHHPRARRAAGRTPPRPTRRRRRHRSLRPRGAARRHRRTGPPVSPVDPPGATLRTDAASRMPAAAMATIRSWPRWPTARRNVPEPVSSDAATACAAKDAATRHAQRQAAQRPATARRAGGDGARVARDRCVSRSSARNAGPCETRRRPDPDREGQRGHPRVDGSAQASEDALDADRRIQQYGLLA